MNENIRNDVQEQCPPLMISNIKTFNGNGKSGIVAFADVTLNDSAVIHGIKVLQGESGLFVSMPQRLVKDEFKDVCHPITREFYDVLYGAVLDAYNGKGVESAEKQQYPPLKVTSARIYSASGRNSVLAYAVVVLNDSAAIHGIRVLQSESGPFVSMPQRLVKDEFKDVFHPITREFHNSLCDAVLDAYEIELGQSKTRG